MPRPSSQGDDIHGVAELTGKVITAGHTVRAENPVIRAAYQQLLAGTLTPDLGVTLTADQRAEIIGAVGPEGDLPGFVGSALIEKDFIDDLKKVVAGAATAVVTGVANAINKVIKTLM